MFPDFTFLRVTSAWPFAPLLPFSSLDQNREKTHYTLQTLKCFHQKKSVNLGLRSNSATSIPIPSHWVVLVLALKPSYTGFLTLSASWLCSTWLSTYYYLGLYSPGGAKLKPNVTVYPILCLVSTLRGASWTV